MSELGRTLILFGAVILVVGVVLVAAGKIPGVRWIGRLPGDFTWRWNGVVLYLPLATGIIASIVLSLLLHFFRR